MKLKAVRSSFGKYGNVRRDDLIEPEDKSEVKALIASGLYVEYDEKAERQAKEDREAKALADAEAAKAAEVADEEAGRALAVQLDVLKSGNATLVLTVAERDTEITGLKSTLADRDAEILGLRGTLEEQNAKLAIIPGLEAEITEKTESLADFQKRMDELVARLAVVESASPAEADDATGKKSAGKKDAK